ncbi:hypothetical protein LTR84_005959 [Exophiala bonariae]|uniref:Uncharacterized protein n=1 Tax=Exophiala bonariae TaxID=1690606 RepID=A0AAV9N5S4_9EURO|nr:hypothetical protein LTR84_005959 [Exophiala bonariae]
MTEVYIIGNIGKKSETWAYAWPTNSKSILAKGRVEQPNTPKALLSGAVEGALFIMLADPTLPGRAANSLEGEKQGGNRTVSWIIDPRVSWQRGSPPKPDSLVGWATIQLATGSPDSKTWEVYPVRASTGKKWDPGNLDGNLWYYFNTTEVLKSGVSGRESNL